MDSLRSNQIHTLTSICMSLYHVPSFNLTCDISPDG